MERRDAPFHDHEVRLPPVPVPKVAQIAVQTLRILPERRPFKQVVGDEALESGGVAGNDGPVEVVVLPILSERPE